jgi:hypothetical protein
MYISLYTNFDRSFKGNQNFNRQRGEVIVRDDDTTYIYKNMSKSNLKEFKNDYKETVKGNFVMLGCYPYYHINYTN